jgi:hypothetical protein
MADTHEIAPQFVEAPWDVLSTGEGIVWTLSEEGGPVQGPLDLGFVAGKRLELLLEEGQVALLSREGGLEAVYLSGRHDLSIDVEAGALSPEGSLLFLDTKRPWIFRWRRGTLLSLELEGERACELEIIGVVVCRIGDPVRFFSAFLAGDVAVEEAALVRLIDTLLRSRLEDHLAATLGEGAADLTRVQSRLTRLDSEDLAEELDAFGLVCDQLSLYTASPPSEEDSRSLAGQMPDALHNRI